MNLHDIARNYLAAIPPAISGQGGHSQTLHAARALVWGFNLPEAQAAELLREWNQACQPPWTEHELAHKLREANSKPFDKPRGYLLDKHGTSIMRSAWRPAVPSPRASPELPTPSYDLSQAPELELPPGKRDGFPQLLEACFLPGEGVRVMSGMDEEGLIRCDPRGGVVLSREEWLAKVEAAIDINGIYYRLGGPPVGVYLGINPMKEDGRGRDSDVTDFRHCLLEFDDISLREQWLLFVKSNLPCAAVIYSGKRSLHAWVKIHAKDRQEYDERVQLLYNHFKAYNPDPHNKNPSRFSRCPDAKRGNSQQLLLALNIGAPSFVEWSKDLLVQGIGTTYTSNEILNYKADLDRLTVVGRHYLRKGGSCLLVGPSGIGKSSLALQIAFSWALGRPCFGIAPVGPLKILMIQAENDLSDLHDMGEGIASGMGILQDPEQLELLLRNLVTNHNVADTGRQFILAMQKLIDHHSPDLVMVDPLLSFIGADISKQEVVGQFCRNWLNPVLQACNVAFLAVHHTGKPPTQKEGKGRRPPDKTLSDWAYHGIGSSELTNWARGIMVLNPTAAHTFDLILAKRGKRAGAVHPNGMPTLTLHLEHAAEGIYWNQVNPPEEPVTASETSRDLVGKKVPIPLQVARSNCHAFLAMIPAEGWTKEKILGPLAKWAASELGLSLSRSTGQRALEELVHNRKLAVTEDFKYVKGSDA